MTPLLLVHGWGASSRVWDPLLAALGEPDAVRVELGYFGQVSMPADLAAPYLAVGHSLGFPWLLSRPERFAWRGLVSVGGFARFLRAPGFPGIHPAALRRMEEGLARDPLALLATFHRQALGPLEGEVPDVGALAAGLAFLGQVDLREELDQWDKPFLALAARDDAIVPQAMTQASFVGREVHLLGEGGHFLHWTRPEWCGERVWTFDRGLQE